MLSAILQEVKRFREKIYGAIRYRRDATFEMIDALCSNVTAQSPIALSLNSHHRRGYASITDVLSEFHKGGETQSSDLLSGLMEEALHSRAGQPYFLCATDATPAPRAYSPTLADRTFVYQPNPTVPGNKPVTIGHKYSSVCCLQSPADTWVLPLSVVRVPSAESDIDLGAKQLREVLAMLRQQAPDKPVVSCVDSAYSTPEYIHSMHGGAGTDNLLTITRLRSNRVLWQKASEKRSVYGNKRGHDRWYGARFSLKDERTWHPPDETHRISSTTKRGKGMLTVIQRWNNLLRRDKRGLPMHLYPFTLLRVVVTNERGEFLFHRPMWLAVYGASSVEISTPELYACYLKRYDIEHYFRFQKQNLLVDKLQTPNVVHAQNGWSIGMLAYAMLFVSRNAVSKTARPWETYLKSPREKAKLATPSMVQRQFGIITSQIGTPAQPPKPRGKPLGRLKGTNPPRRVRHPIVLKQPKPPDKKAV